MALTLIEPLLDDELDAVRKSEIEHHLADCAGCRTAYERLRSLRNDLRTFAPRYDASAQLRTRIQASLKQEAAVTRMPSRPFRAWAVAATALLAVSAGWNVWLVNQQGRDEVAQEIVSSHIRSLIGDHLLDVQSTDQHNVKPWFNGRLDYSPDVRDFAAEGFPLIGGRVDYLDHRSVAVMVYKRRQHTINVFAWPRTSPLAAPLAQNGFNLMTWENAGIAYCAVSDLNTAELSQFAGLYRR